MLVTVRTLNTQRRIQAKDTTELDSKIKELYKTDTYKLFTDSERTQEIGINEMKDRMFAFMSYDMGEIKEYRPKPACKHGEEQVCAECADLERMDRTETKKVRYLSRDAYHEALKKQGMTEPTYEYGVRVCEEHGENERCSRCAEKRITLLGQPYRAIDYVEFDSRKMVENMVNRFRESERQRIGLIIGKYAPYPEVPQGKKAVVSAILDVEEESFPDGVVINKLPDEFPGDLKIIGVIYTDLKYSSGKFSSYKKEGGYLISTVELYFVNFIKENIGNQDFVAICLSANDSCEVEPTVFMVTDQFSSLLKHECVCLTTDPEHLLAKREIAYFTMDKYDNKVSKTADPLLPISYFFVFCECGFKENSVFAHEPVIKNPSLKKLAAYFEGDYEFEKFRNFSVLMGLKTLIPAIFPSLVDAVVEGNETGVKEIVDGDIFQGFTQEMMEYDVRGWICPACTYKNKAFNSSCEMCGNGRV